MILDCTTKITLTVSYTFKIVFYILIIWDTKIIMALSVRKKIGEKCTDKQAASVTEHFVCTFLSF